MCQRCFGGCLCTEQMVYSLLNQFGFDVIFHAAKLLLFIDTSVVAFTTNAAEMVCATISALFFSYEHKRISPSSELGEILARSKLQYTIIAL